jgi:predicted O-methyltransferase YrrM
MDVERFAAELPALFDDFPDSPHPRGRRFDDIAEAVPNLACENNLALVNLAASLLEDGESYVELGTYHGASLIAAMRGNEGRDFVAIDNFSMGPVSVRGRSNPPVSRAALEANLRRFGAEGATILEGDALELLEQGALRGRRVGVFYYDAAHSYEAHIRALQLVEPYLAERALLIVDDSDWEQVGRAIRDYLAAQPQARMLIEIEGAAADRPWWWEGVAVLAWEPDS